MSSYVLAIWSDGHGNPFTGAGKVGHVVRVAPYAGMPIVNEFTDGGAFEHADCAPACIDSRLLQAGIHVGIPLIEQRAGTGPNGSLFPGIERCLRSFGVVNVFSGADPPAGWIMNPAGGRLVSPVAFPQYLAASQGGCIVMADPPVPTPPIPPPPIEEPEMQTFVIDPGATPTLVPGLTGTSTLNLAADTTVSVELFIWEPDGTPVASKLVTLEGNGAIAHKGPIQVSGYLRNVLGVPAFMSPCTLYLAPAAARYSVSVY